MVGVFSPGIKTSFKNQLYEAKLLFILASKSTVVAQVEISGPKFTEALKLFPSIKTAESNL